LIAKGQSARAINVLEAGQVATNQSLEIALDLGALYAVAGRNDDAIKLFEGVLDRVPGDPVAANNLAMLLANHRTDEASLDRAAQLVERFADSDNPAFLDTYGWVAHRRGRHAEAVAALEAAVARAPDAAELRYHLGMAQLGAGNTAEARKHLELAVRSSQDFAGRAEAKAALAGL
jgi:tetratricopeptide (TPR) repeat protein